MLGQTEGREDMGGAELGTVDCISHFSNSTFYPLLSDLSHRHWNPLHRDVICQCLTSCPRRVRLADPKFSDGTIQDTHGNLLGTPVHAACRAEQLTPWHWGQPSLGGDWELVDKFFSPLL